MVTAGASFVGWIKTSRVATFDRLFAAAPSSTRNETVRVDVDGLSDVFWYSTERSAAW